MQEGVFEKAARFDATQLRNTKDVSWNEAPGVSLNLMPAPGRPPAACDRYCGQQKVQCPVRRAPCTAPGAAFLPKIWHLRPHGASRDRRTGGPLPGSAPGPGQLPAADHAGKAGAAGSPGLADQSTAAIRRRAGDISGRKTDIVTWKKREHHVDVPAFSAFSEELGRISPAHKPPSVR